MVSLQKSLALFLLIRKTGEIIRNKHFSSQENMLLLYIKKAKTVNNIAKIVTLLFEKRNFVFAIITT